MGWPACDTNPPTIVPLFLFCTGHGRAECDPWEKMASVRQGLVGPMKKLRSRISVTVTLLMRTSAMAPACGGALDIEFRSNPADGGSRCPHAAGEDLAVAKVERGQKVPAASIRNRVGVLARALTRG